MTRIDIVEQLYEKLDLPKKEVDTWKWLLSGAQAWTPEALIRKK